MKNARLLTVGCLLWAVGTILIRLGGQHLLHTGRPVQTIALYLVSAIAMAIVVRRISGRYEGGRVNAAALLALPTLFLDPFSCLFFTTIFPNVDAAAAGLFGGWMLICCGGAIGGALAFR